MNVQEWLNQSPKPEEIFYLDEKNKTGKYIPYEIIVEKLYQLCGHHWSGNNLHVTYMNLPNRKTLVTGTIEVEVNYCFTGEKGIEIIKRVLPGGSNFVVNNTKIPYTTASVKSLAIMNAVKPLGKQFGWQLNEGEDEIVEILKETNDEEIDGYIEAINTCVSLKTVEIYKKLVEREDIPKLTEAYNLKLKQLRKSLPKPKKIQLP